MVRQITVYLRGKPDIWIGQDDELLIDAPDAEPSDLNAVQPVEGDMEMHVDEEGRPRFAPAKSVVCIASENATERVLISK